MYYFGVWFAPGKRRGKSGGTAEGFEKRDCEVRALAAKSGRMNALKVYTYANCDTCRKAVNWLRAHELAFDELPIRETPPTLAELRTMLMAQGGELRRMFNISGKDYREQKLGERLPGLSEAAALALLAGNGNLVKRPFLLGGKAALVGFDEKAWAATLLS